MSKETESELLVAGTGLIGKKVAEIARSKDISVSVTAKNEQEDSSGTAEILDITDSEAVQKYFRDHHFKKVIVAAGIALPAAAKENPEQAFLVNAEAPRNIGRAILALPAAHRPSVVFMGSALQYDIQHEGAVTEDTPQVTEGDPYVMSKIKMVEFVKELVAQGLDAKIAMIFNSTGPDQSPSYFLPSMADQIAQIKLGLKDTKVVQSRYVGHDRDFSHVDDTAQGILLALQGRSGELINISSGYGIRLQDFIYTLMDISGVRGIRHQVDPQFNTPPKIHAFWGDNSRLKSLGFIPQKNMVDICYDLFEARLRANQG